MICSHLGDHICADHGLLMKTSNGSNELDKLHICHIDQIYEAKLSQTTEFTAQIWHVSTASVDMSCYFWCQNEIISNSYEIKELDGIPLDSKKVRKIQVLIFFDSNNNFFNFFKGLVKMATSFDEKLSYMSSRMLYDFSLNQNGYQCQDEMCHTYSRFQWHSPYPCDVILVCNTLTGMLL